MILKQQQSISILVLLQQKALFSPDLTSAFVNNYTQLQTLYSSIITVNNRHPKQTHHNINQMIFSKLKYIITIIAILSLFKVAQSYIDVDLIVATSSADISLNMPITINNAQYHIAISLYNQQEFIVSPNLLAQSNNQKYNKTEEAKGVMQVSSLQGYNLQGWKRFILEVIFFENSKYSHTINLDLGKVKQVEKKHTMTNGIMTIGPQLQKNQIYKLIKEQTADYFREDIVSFYTIPGGRGVKMQLGGFQDENARGYDNGIRFYEKPINKTVDGKGWVLPVSKLVIAKEISNRWDCYNIPSTALSLKITLQSQFVILPSTMKEDLETSFQSSRIQCQFAGASGQLQCANMSSIDQALTFVSLYLDAFVSINISLYQLRDSYNPKEKLTSFFLKLGNPEELQIGYPLLLGHYVSLNLNKSSLLFSPLNRFSPEISSAAILRFIIIFMLFMLAACVCLVIWQQFGGQALPKRHSRPIERLRLTTYHKPAQFDQEDFS